MNAHPKAPKQVELTGFKRWRFSLLLGVLGVLLAAIALRVGQLHTFEQPFLSKEGDKRMVRVKNIPAMRGMITDRNGKPLAVSTPVYNLYVRPQMLEQTSLSKVAKLIGVKASKLNRKVAKARKKKTAFMYLKRQISPAKAEKIKALKIKGLFLEDDFRRFYPAAEVTAHLVGAVNIDDKGQEGLELAYDNYLKKQEGKSKIVQNSLGQTIKQLEVIKTAQPGKNLKLTIDLRLQYLAYRELKAAVKVHKARWGSAVLLDAKKGEVLALVNQPSYNPNNRRTFKPDNMRNRALTNLIEPGSTFKPFTVASALDLGTHEASSTINTAPGYIRIKRKTIRDHRNYGELDLTGVIKKSSNIGVVKIAEKLGAESLWEKLNQLAISMDSLNFPGEAIGTLPYPEELDELRLATLSYGYGLSLTPLKLAESYTSFSNKGCRSKPSLILSQSAKEPCHQVMQPATAKTLLGMLETVTADDGTASRVQLPHYRVGGKTGTAHKLGKRGYEDASYRALFAGIAPISQPDLILVVVIDDPKGREYYGGEVAAPVFARIMEQALRLRQVAPDKSLPKESLLTEARL